MVEYEYKVPFTVVLWAEGFGLDTNVFEDAQVKEAIRQQDGATAIKYMNRLLYQPAFNDPAVKLEFLELVESGGKTFTPFTDISKKPKKNV